MMHQQCKSEQYEVKESASLEAYYQAKLADRKHVVSGQDVNAFRTPLMGKEGKG